MHEDIGALGIAAARRTSRAPPSTCRRCCDLIGTLERKGLAYRARQRRRELRGAQVPGYGKLSGKSLDELRAGERVAVLDGKDDPLDFVLWKAAKAERARRCQVATAPSAPGRPGWHIECSAMSCAAARRALRHPRRRHGPAVPAPRERDRAERRRHRQAASSTYWLHNGFLNVDNEKMSKSLGNFFTIRDVLRALRRRDAALLHAAHALPQPVQLQRRATSTTRAARCAGSTPRSTACRRRRTPRRSTGRSRRRPPSARR